MEDSRFAAESEDRRSADRRLLARPGTMSKARSSRVLRASSSRDLMGREASDRVAGGESSYGSERRASRESAESNESLDGSRSQRVSLSATSYHGGRTSANAAGSSSRSRRGVGPPGRHKSTDNPELLGAGPASSSSSRRGDELGATTLHGTSVSRIRSQRGVLQRQQSRRGSTSMSKGDRRPAMKRAMSTENVKRPEEYGPRGTTAAPSSMYGSGEVRRGRRRPKVEDDEALVVEVDEIESEEVEENSDDDSEGDDSFAAEDDDDEPKHDSPVRTANSNRKGEARRDLSVLVRDQKTVHLADFNDQENRRLLHFLIFQHKLGVDLAELQATVAQDIAMHGAEALRRPVPPLYVEPA
jgi:hypothetical protein